MLGLDKSHGRGKERIKEFSWWWKRGMCSHQQRWWLCTLKIPSVLNTGSQAKRKKKKLKQHMLTQIQNSIDVDRKRSERLSGTWSHSMMGSDSFFSCIRKWEWWPETGPSREDGDQHVLHKTRNRISFSAWSQRLGGALPPV